MGTFFFKKMIRTLFLLILSSTCFAGSYDAFKDEVIAFSYPKSGTHLFMILLEELFDGELQGSTPGIKNDAEHDTFYLFHHYSLRQLADLPLFTHRMAHGKKTFLIVRDLRDVVCSLNTFVETKGVLFTPNLLILFLHGLLPEDPFEVEAVVQDVVQANKKMLKKERAELVKNWHTYPLDMRLSALTKVLAYQWRDVHDLCGLGRYIESGLLSFIRFEDLVDEVYGGEKVKLERAIEKTATFLSVPLSEEKKARIVTRLKAHPRAWSMTNVQRKVGRWKGEFSAENGALFEKLLNKTNALLGY